MSASESVYLYDKAFEAKRKRWNEQRLAEQREIARIMGLPEPEAVLTPREAERVFGKAARKTAPSAVIPIKPPVSNPYKRLASKEHRQNNTLRKALGGSPAPAPSAPAPTHNKAVEIGGLVFAGSVAETIEGAAR